MGCASSIDDSILPIRIPSKIGVLKVLIIDASIEHETTKVFSMDPYVKLKISNQQYQTNYIYKGGATPKFNQTFEFVINSCYKKFGRKLEIQMWDRNKISDSQIGYGLLDLDPVISGKMPTKDLRVFLNYQREQAGIVNIKAQFTQMPYQTISFRFQLASLRNKTRKFGEMNCCVKVTFGEEELNTKYVIDSKNFGPRWPQDILTFYIPKFVQKGKIQVFDQSILIGTMQIIVQQILTGQDRQLYNQQLFIDDGTPVKALAGNLKFQVIKGTATFQDLSTQNFNLALKQSILKSAMKLPVQSSIQKIRVKSARIPGMDSTDNLILELRQQEQWAKLQKERLLKEQQNLQKQRQALKNKLIEAQKLKSEKLQKKKIEEKLKKQQEELKKQKQQQQKKRKQEEMKKFKQEEQKKKQAEQRKQKEQEQKKQQQDRKKKQEQEKRKQQQQQKKKEQQENKKIQEQQKLKQQQQKRRQLEQEQKRIREEQEKRNIQIQEQKQKQKIPDIIQDSKKNQIQQHKDHNPQQSLAQNTQNT